MTLFQTTAYFGALVYGSDIDGRQMRGKSALPCPVFSMQTDKKNTNTPGIVRAATQYGVSERIVDLCTFDITHHPWRCGSLFDAMITDPPCE